MKKGGAVFNIILNANISLLLKSIIIKSGAYTGHLYDVNGSSPRVPIGHWHSPQSL